VVVCLERGADLHTAQLMPLPLTVSCFSKIQIGFAFLVPADPGSPGKKAVKRVCVCTETLVGRIGNHTTSQLPFLRRSIFAEIIKIQRRTRELQLKMSGILFVRHRVQYTVL